MFGFSFFKRGKKKEENENLKTKVYFQKIEKEDESFIEKGDYFLDIATIAKNKNEFEFVVNFENNTDKHIRIKILNIQLIHNGKEYNGDSFIYELKMGTNDAILKNTVIAQGTLLKNILFKDLDLNQILGDDYIIIELLINDEPYVLENSINGSSVDQIKIITIE
jgi:hypothetical protein